MATCFAIISSVAVATAETVVLYGNIPDPIVKMATTSVGRDFYPSDENVHTLAAQPFITGELGIVSSISLPVAVNGSPTGVVHFEIWDDNSGSPGNKVASVGDIDLDSWIGADLVYQLVTFDRPVTGLEPNTQYHVLFDNTDTDVSGASHTWFTRMTADSEGTNNAGKLQIPPGGNWVPRSNFVANMNYLVLEILEISPSPIDEITLTSVEFDPIAGSVSVSLTWPSHPDAVYEIGMSTDLVDWELIETKPSTGEQTTTVVSAPGDAPQRFFRLREKP